MGWCEGAELVTTNYFILLVLPGYLVSILPAYPWRTIHKLTSVMRRLSSVAPAALCLFFAFALSSCFTPWEINASYDLSKDGEKGPSGETAHYNPGFNFLIEALDEISDGGLIMWDDDKATFDNPPGPWNPERYFPANKPTNSFGLVTTGGYIEKGRKVGDVSEHLDYLEASEALAFMHKTSGGVLYGGLGPYVAYGFAGRVNYSGGSTDDVFGGQGYHRFDAGLHFLGEYRFKMGLSVGAGFDLGIYDKSTDPSDYTSRNRTMMVDVGYSFEKIIGAFKRK
jgi:hypothetical protein